MTTIKLYDSAINAINGQSNPQSQVGDTQNVDIQDILEMIREGRVTEAVELLDQAGITSMTTEENGTKVVTFEFENRNYTIRYNPTSSDTSELPTETPTRQFIDFPRDTIPLASCTFWTSGDWDDKNIAANAKYIDLFELQSVFGADDIKGDEEYSPIEIEGVEKIAKYLGSNYYTADTIDSIELARMGLQDTPSNRIYAAFWCTLDRILHFNNVTPEDVTYINEHPELFNGIICDFSQDYDPSTGKMLNRCGIACSEYTKYLRCLNGELMSQDDAYEKYINTFSNYLSDDSEIYGLPGGWLTEENYNVYTPVYNVKLDGNNIEFTENTVKAIKIYLEKIASYARPYDEYLEKEPTEPSNFMKLFGLDFYDDEETIWAKINAFCNENGSNDGKTLSLKDYYNIIAENEVVTDYFTHSYDTFKPTSCWPTREQCGIILSDYPNGLKIFFENQGIPLPNDNLKTQGNSVSGRTSTSAREDINVSSSPTMPVGGIEITDDDIEYARKEKQQQIIDDFIENIKKFNNYRGSSDPNSFRAGNIPIYAVELDGNGNVIIGDQFKDALKKYLTALVNAIKFNIATYDSSLQMMRDRGDNSGLAMSSSCQEQFLALFGLTECPMDFTEPYEKKPNMEAWMADIQSYIDDDTKMNDLLSTFCTNLGSTDGETVSVEQYYNKLAENNIYEYISACGQSPVTFSKDNNIDSYAKIEAYLVKLKEKYPEVYNDYYYYISDGNSSYYSSSTGKVRGDSYVLLQGRDELYENPQFNDVLRVAAGITGNDSFSEQREKMKNLFIKMGADPNDRYLGVDVTQLMNYLLGDNSEHVNYFDKLKAQMNALTEKLINTQLEIGVPDNNIKVEHYEPPKAVGTTGTSDIIDEISDYLKELVQPIYDKYYIYDYSSSQFINFTHIPRIQDPDDPGYGGRLTHVWKDTALKEACAKEMEEAAQKLLEKYSDILTSVIYDGQKILFSTVYDDDSPNNGYSMIGTASVSRTTALNGLAHTAGGINEFLSNVMVSGFEATIDSPKIYSSTPKVIENNIPQNAPVGLNSENLIKTAWDGIWVSENGDYIYLWDSKNQKYLAIKNYIASVYGGSPAQILANGLLDCLPVNDREDGGYEIDNILLSLVYGYNRTESPYIFEKDGKYYAYDAGVQNHEGYTGLERLKDMLIELSLEKPEESPVTHPAEKPQEPSTPEESPVIPPVEDSEVPDIQNTSSQEAQDDYYTALDKKIALLAAELGYKKGDDGNYYYGEGNNTYICLWNPWTEKFDKYLVASEEPENVELVPNEDGGFDAIVPTLDNLFAESCIAAKAEGFVPSDDTGVFERDNERYVYDITTHTFIKESDAIKTNKKTWVQVFREAYALAQQLGYTPSSVAFCIFEDENGNKFKYDVDKGKFIALS